MTTENKKAAVSIRPLYIDLATVAAVLSVSVSTVQALVRAGDLPKPRKLSGGRVAWLMREVEAWAESRPESDFAPPPNTGAKKPRATARQSPPSAQTIA
jgi:prophage regulatory protein